MHIYGKRRKKSVFKQNNEWKKCLKNDEKYTKKKNNYWNQSNSVCRTQRHSCTFFVCLLRYTLFDAITATARTYLMNNSKNMSTNVYLMSFYHFVLPSTNGIFFTYSLLSLGLLFFTRNIYCTTCFFSASSVCPPSNAYSKGHYVNCLNFCIIEMKSKKNENNSI